MLAFSLKTHKHFFVSAEGELEEKHEHWSRGKAITILLVATAVVAMLSEFLVGTIESMRATFGITEVFVGVIVVAIVGNAAEHSTAIIMAMKNKMDLSVGIAIGSSLQIALFVAPVLVFLSYFFGRPMDLEFSLPEIFAVVASVYILFPDQRRRRNELDRRRPASLGLSDSRNPVLLFAGTARGGALMIASAGAAPISSGRCDDTATERRGY